MSNYDNTNRGQIWGNEKKQKDTHPDYTGTLNVEGVEYWVSAWKRKPDANPKAPALSFSIKLKESTRTSSVDKSSVAQAAPDQGGDPWSDDIPFAPMENI